jgi:phage baseplate assembly protein W
MMMGMDEATGLMISGEEYARQCIRRLMKTLKRSMVMYRELGPDLQPYLAAPMTDVWLLSLSSELIDSVERLMPELKVLVVNPSVEDGQLSAEVSVQWQDTVFTVSDTV